MSDFDFIEHYGEEVKVDHEQQLPENEAVSSINCAFVGFGGGGGKLAKAFLDLAGCFRPNDLSSWNLKSWESIL